jgi:UDP-N-acetylmuramate--alanine ligase
MMSRVHLIGIGGAGLSAIATVLLQQGYTVSGSDQQASATTERLAQLGATIFIGHRPENLDDRRPIRHSPLRGSQGRPPTHSTLPPPGVAGQATNRPSQIPDPIPHIPDHRSQTIDLVVISSAIPPDNPELVEARQRGLKVVKRAEWVGQMMQGRVGIAVAGTHGKTTTTAMIAFILQQAGHEPTYIVGGFVPQLDTNAAAGQGDAFVIEADEYDYTFLGLRPEIAVVTIVEWDHPDIFPSPLALKHAFEDFVRLVPAHGQLIGCGDDLGALEAMRRGIAPITTYGLGPENDWQAVEVRPNQRGGHDFRVNRLTVLPSPRFTVSLAVPGLHNVNNALAALIVAQQRGLDLAQAAEILGEFRGVGRRFELKGEVKGITVIDDYAHHPTEIRATLAAARTRFAGRSLWAAFQPHTFSRTLALLDDFAHAFTDADHVIMVDIFPSREIDQGQIKSIDIVDRMRHPDARYIGPLAEAAGYLATQLVPPAVLITMGAGDSYKIGEWVLESLGN